MKIKCSAREKGVMCQEPSAGAYDKHPEWPLCERHLAEARAIMASVLNDDEGRTSDA